MKNGAFKGEFGKVLIANRGEIAVRIARTLRDMGITAVAVYSDADRAAPHVLACDQAVHLGGSTASESYLDIDKVIAAAKSTGVEAIHPGYGFLSENSDFAARLADAGMVLIGPPAEAMRVMGSKTESRGRVSAAGVPCVPGSAPLADVEEAARLAEDMGYPVMLKASAGGGGKGMRWVAAAAQLADGLRAARSEAKNAFGDDTVYLEKAIVEPKHVEMQIFSGADGKAVWLGERECSMQRRHQKIIEESPSPVVDEALRRQMGEVACKAADSVGYVGAGTVEFLLDRNGAFYFLEMNTRLQVEHPVTEMCCGVDLVQAQVQVAAGKALPWGQNDISRQGHAIEARLYAEDPRQNFMPSPGLIAHLQWPRGPGIRVDEGVRPGLMVSRFYDPMLAKIIAWGSDREQARRRLVRALGETQVGGITTNLLFLSEVLQEPSFVDGSYHTGTVGEMMLRPATEVPKDMVDVAVMAASLAAFDKDRQKARLMAAQTQSGQRSPWRWRGR